MKPPVNRYNTVTKPIPFSSGFIPCARAFVVCDSALKAHEFAFLVRSFHVKMWSIVRRVRALCIGKYFTQFNENGIYRLTERFYVPYEQEYSKGD